MSVPGHDYDGLPEGERDIYAGFRAAEANAVPPPQDEPPPHDGDPGGGPPGPPGGLDDVPARPWPAGCPVVPLGHHGGRFYYLTRSGQLASLRAEKHTTLGIGGHLFEGDTRWLWQHFPAMQGRGKREVQVGWDATEAAMALMHQASACGIIDVASEVRGLGAWTDPTDPARLIFHAGDELLVDGAWRAPGRHGRFLYAGDRAIDRPGDAAMTPAEARRLLDLIGTWRFEGHRITPRLVLGWVVAAGVPGALDWRPSIWFSGDKSTGKTTLLWLLGELLGSTGLSLAHLTEAGVRQALSVNALAVLVDEFELQDLGPIVSDVMRFVRVASSGRSGRVVKGGMDGVPTFTTLVGAFAFSSIYRPPLTPQDRQRLTLVEVNALTAARPPDDDAGAAAAIPATVVPMTGARRTGFQAELKRLARLGPALRRRVVDNWHRFPELLNAYMAALETAGHDQRAREHYGTLLACADLVLSDEPPDASALAPFVEQLALDTVDDGGADDPDHEVWLRHLFQSPHPNWRNGEHRPIGRLVAKALLDAYPEDWVLSDLRAVGLMVKTCAKEGEKPTPHLLVSNTHPTLAGLFGGTRFAGVEWRQILRRAPGAFAAGQTRFDDDYNTKAMAVPAGVLPIGTAHAAPKQDRNADRNSETGGAPRG